MTNSLPINFQRMHYEDVTEADSCSACGSHDAYADCSTRTGGPLPTDEQSDRQVTQGQPGEVPAIIPVAKPRDDAWRVGTGDDERQAKIAALHATLSEEVEALMTSDGWAAMLAASARFTHYSLNNTLLLMAQTYRRGMATDSRVAGFNTWKSLGRMVRKGEKGLAIFAPCTYRPKGEEGEETPAKKVVRGFRVAYVFAESQTDGADIPNIRPSLLPGDAPDGLWASLADLVAAEGFELERGDCGQANGYTDRHRKVVRVRAAVSDAQAVKTLAHELAHVLLHCDPAYNYGECRGAAEVEAESISYVVSAASGLNTTAYAAPYVAGWAGGDIKRVKHAADRVVSTSGLILARLESRALVAA